MKELLIENWYGGVNWGWCGVGLEFQSGQSHATLDHFTTTTSNLSKCMLLSHSHYSPHVYIILTFFL